MCYQQSLLRSSPRLPTVGRRRTSGRLSRIDREVGAHPEGGSSRSRVGTAHLYGRLIAATRAGRPRRGVHAVVERQSTWQCERLPERRPLPDQAELIHAWKRQRDGRRSVIPGMPELVERVRGGARPSLPGQLEPWPPRTAATASSGTRSCKGSTARWLSGADGPGQAVGRDLRPAVSRFEVEPAESTVRRRHGSNVRRTPCGFRAHHSPSPRRREVLEAHGL